MLDSSAVVELLTSDGGILAFTAVGIVATAVSIVRDARRQRARMPAEVVAEELPLEERAA